MPLLLPPNSPLWGPVKEPSPLLLNKGEGNHSCLEGSPAGTSSSSQARKPSHLVYGETEPRA